MRLCFHALPNATASQVTHTTSAKPPQSSWRWLPPPAATFTEAQHDAKVSTAGPDKHSGIVPFGFEEDASTLGPSRTAFGGGLAVKAWRREAAVQGVIAHFANLVVEGVVQSECAGVAPEAIEAVTG